MGHLNNLHNGYQQELGDLFDEIPKAVLAAIAVSALTDGGDRLDEAKHRVAQEWGILHQNGIVPQKPGKIARALGAVAKPWKVGETIVGTGIGTSMKVTAVTGPKK